MPLQYTLPSHPAPFRMPSHCAPYPTPPPSKLCSGSQYRFSHRGDFPLCTLKYILTCATYRDTEVYLHYSTSTSTFQNHSVLPRPALLPVTPHAHAPHDRSCFRTLLQSLTPRIKQHPSIQSLLGPDNPPPLISDVHLYQHTKDALSLEPETPTPSESLPPFNHLGDRQTAHHLPPCSPRSFPTPRRRYS